MDGWEGDMSSKMPVYCRKCSSTVDVNYLTLECLNCSIKGSLTLDTAPSPNLSEYYDDRADQWSKEE